VILMAFTRMSGRSMSPDELASRQRSGSGSKTLVAKGKKMYPGKDTKGEGQTSETRRRP
jgi:hypothetical protein